MADPEPGPAAFLPEHIRDVLKRKSSRDPASRFTKKLHILLGYVDQTGDYERVGLAWVTDDEFKMNKTVLASVIGIKLNTLNVNLRDLHFTLTLRDKDGWTHWKHEGFTRRSSGIDPDEAPALQLPPVPSAIGLPPKSLPEPFMLGRLSREHHQRFYADTHTLWAEIFQCPPTVAVGRDVAIDRAAKRFRHNEQPLQNAREVIEAIILTGPMDPKLTFTDFCRFLAMFGPADGVMPKIAALLTCSNATGKWLTFDRLAPKLPFAAFDETVPNCLIVHHGDHSTEKVFNNPTTETMYLIDDFGRTSRDWDEWFTAHPVRPESGLAYDRYAYL
jgi:hypothetical protein